MRMMTKEDRAAYKAAFTRGKTKIAVKGLELEFYVEDRGFRLMAFRGTAGKPFAHYTFKTAAQREAYMKRLIESEKISAAYKASRKPSAKPRKLQVGHILYTSWGYDQTNTDFYQVTALKGETMVIVQKLASSTEETGFMSGKTLPADKLVGKPIACRVSDGDRITVDGHAAWLWNGTPKAVSWYA